MHIIDYMQPLKTFFFNDRTGQLDKVTKLQCLSSLFLGLLKEKFSRLDPTYIFFKNSVSVKHNNFTFTYFLFFFTIPNTV